MKGVAFSTYAVKSIRRTIRKGIVDNDDTVRRPVYFNTILASYYRLIEEYRKRNMPLPDDDEMCQILDVTLDTLNLLKNDRKLNADSLDRPVKDEDGYDISDTVASDIDDYNDVLNKITSNHILAFLKIKLKKNPIEYYVLYHRVLKDPQDTLEVVSKRLAISRERVRVIQENTIKKVRQYYNENGEFIGKLSSDLRKVVDAGRFKIEPVSPEDVTRFLFARDHLDIRERELLEILIFDNIGYSKGDLAQKFDISISELENLQVSLKRHLEMFFTTYQKLYTIFSRNIISHYKSKILRISHDIDIKPFTVEEYNYTAKLWESGTYKDAIDSLNSSNISVTPALNQKIRQYFSMPPEGYKLRRLEGKLNIFALGLTKSSEIPHAQLDSTLKSNLHRFTHEQAIELSYMLGKISLSEAKRQYPNFEFKGETNSKGYERLHSIHFGLRDYKSLGFDKEKYSYIRSKVLDDISPEKIQVLDYYLGYEDKAHTIDELAAHLKVSSKEAQKAVDDARTEVINIYLGISSHLKLDMQIYADYIREYDVDFGEPINSVLRLFLLENESYDEIATTLGIKNKKVATYLTSGITKIDYLRLNVTSDITYTKDELLSTLEASRKSEKTKEILRDRIAGIGEKTLAAKHGVSIHSIRQAMSDLRAACKTRRVESVMLSKEEIERGIMMPEVSNILPIKARQILSLLYGIKNEYNLSGETYTIIQTAEIVGLARKSVSDYRNLYITNLKLKKINLLRAPLDVINRKELIKLLDDAHAPISLKERETLEMLYGLNSHKPHSCEEICAYYGEDDSTIRYRIRHAAINLKRYALGEIEGITSFEADVSPFLRYFTNSDRQILTELYKEKMTIEAIGKKHKMTHDQIFKTTYRLRLYLKELQEGRTPGLDFDYFWNTVNDEDVPFYGNKTLAIELFDLYYEKNLAYAEIQRRYHPELSVDRISKNVFWLTIAVMKRKIGIKKGKDYTYEQVRDHFLAHSNEMGTYEKAQYCQYFKSFDPNRVPTRSTTPNFVAANLLREEEGYIELKPKNREAILKLITENKDKFSDREIYEICYNIGANTRQFMKGSDQRRVLELLMSVNKKDGKHLTMAPKSKAS